MPSLAKLAGFDLSGLPTYKNSKMANLAYLQGDRIKLFFIQGVHLNVSKVICLWESLKIQNMNSDWCFHCTEIGPFWDLVSKKFHKHSVIIHLWRLWSCIIAEISKIHWKSRIKKHQYCFENISATKAQIFMKFYVGVIYYLVIICIKFH